MINKTIGTLIVVLVLNFFLPRWMPGDPFDTLSVDEGDIVVTLSEDQISYYKEYYGMDQPMHIQFISYMKNTLIGNFGISIFYNRSITEMIMERIIWTLALVVLSLTLSSLIGTLLGLVSAYYAQINNWIDGLLIRLMTVLSEIPDFMIGIFMLFIFAAKLKWFPLSGGTTAFAEYNSIYEAIGDYVHHAALPCMVLIFSSLGDFFLLSRQSMIGILRQPYIETAKAKGLGKVRLMIHHVLLNAFSPIVARIFMKLGMMLGSAVLVENIFAYPGVGKLISESVLLRDYVMIQGIFFYMAVFVLVFNLMADLIYKKTNKRGQHETL